MEILNAKMHFCYIIILNQLSQLKPSIKAATKGDTIVQLIFLLTNRFSELTHLPRTAYWNMYGCGQVSVMLLSIAQYHQLLMLSKPLSFRNMQKDLPFASNIKSIEFNILV